MPGTASSQHEGEQPLHRHILILQRRGVLRSKRVPLYERCRRRQEKVTIERSASTSASGTQHIRTSMKGSVNQIVPIYVYGLSRTTDEAPLPRNLPDHLRIAVASPMHA